MLVSRGDVTFGKCPAGIRCTLKKSAALMLTVGIPKPVKNKVIRLGTSGLKFCAIFCRDGEEGSDEECKLFRKFISCK